MIRKEELRLGSFVLYKEYLGYDEWELYVDMLSEETVNLANEHGIYTGIKWENVAPLPLFYWHLEAAGFEKISGEVYRLGEWVVDCGAHLAIWKENIRFNVPYVHQLQNLLQSVSGIELNFSNPG